MADQRPIGYWLKLVDRMIDDQFANTLEEHGVTRRQWQLLNVLAQNPATAEQLDAAVPPIPSPADDPAEAGETAADHLSELVESAWVDRTTIGFELTDRGRGALERLSTVVAEQRTTMAAGVAEHEYVTTITTLETMARNLGWTEP